MRASPLLLATALFVSGCVTPASTLDTPTSGLEPAGPVLRVGDVGHDATQGFRWSGGLDKGLKQTFTLELPDRFWDTHTGALEVSTMWPHNGTGTFTVVIADASGKAVARGINGWYASVALVRQAEAGTYGVNIQSVGGSGGPATFDAIIQLDAAPKSTATGAARLPNLVTIPPVDLQITNPGVLGTAASDGAPNTGCGHDETVEHRALRCLRVSNGVGNIGEGRLEVRLSFGEAAKAPAGMGVWMQRLYHDDGTIEEKPVGDAVFHATHGHWHYSGLAKFDLYKYDLASKTRGEHVGKSNKNGFCFFDIGLVELGLPNTPMKGYSGSACLAPNEQQQAWFMGLSPNWFDFYHWYLPDQYVEISGLVDGVYELVSTASGSGLLHETDKTDNAASAVIRITGNQVETLASWADYQK